MNESASAKCPECGGAMSAGGICPRCAARLLQGEQTEFTGGDRAANESGKAPPTIAELAEKFPQLEIIQLLGRGGMGVVYKARQKALNRLVALKLLAPERVDDPKFAERFAREAQALAALSHSNIVTVHDFGQAGGYYFLLMEFIDGVNLRQALEGGRFTPEQALAIVPPICDALEYAHQRGIVHRDIKPENLLLDKEGRVKIADFGIAKMLGAGVAEAEGMQATAAGTPQYMAPEQRENPARADHRADIYSLGVVLYELLTGELPGARLQKPSQKVQIDVRLDEVVLRALEKEPNRRYATAGEFKTSLQTVAGAEAPSPVRDASLARTAQWALGLLLAGILGPLVLMNISRRDEISLTFGVAALVLALIFGLGSRRERLGRIVATIIVSLFGVAAAAAVISVGLYFLRGSYVKQNLEMQQQLERERLEKMSAALRAKGRQAEEDKADTQDGSKRERFVPVEGMANQTSWSVHPKPSFLNANGWAVMARMSLGGVARIQLPGQSEPRCEITLLNGNDEGITLRIDDLVRQTSMTLSLVRDRPGEIRLDGKGYRVVHPSIRVALRDPDTSPFAHVIVTPIESENSGKDAADAAANFGPVIERTLGAGPYQFLTLHDGRMRSEVSDDQGSVSLWRDQGGKILLRFAGLYNVRLDMAEGEKQWKSAMASKVISDYREAGFGLLPEERVSTTEIKSEDLPMTFLLPGVGYLQAIELIEGANPRVKVRYKLIQGK